MTGAIKAVVAGAKGCGKTEALRSLSEHAAATLCDGPSHAPVCLDALVDLSAGMGRTSTCALELWDCSGEPRMVSMSRPFLRDPAFVLLVFDVTSRQSFVALDDLVESCRRLGERPPAVVLLGTKADQHKTRLVGKDDVGRWMEKAGVQDYFETAALTCVFDASEADAARWHSSLVSALQRGIERALAQGHTLVRSADPSGLREGGEDPTPEAGETRPSGSGGGLSCAAPRKKGDAGDECVVS